MNNNGTLPHRNPSTPADRLIAASHRLTRAQQNSLTQKRLECEARERQSLHRRGRKLLFREAMITEGYKLGALGLTLNEIATFWNVSAKSLARWRARCPDFAVAVQRGRDEADATVIQALFDQAKAGNVTAMIFWLKNRQPTKWRDKHDLEHSGGLKDNHVCPPTEIIFTAVKEEVDAHTTG